MNERIKNLLAKAHLDVMENLGDADTNHVAERFAELIVNECNKIMAKQYQGPIPQDVRHMMLVLQEHFGVEDAPVNDVDRILQTVRTRGVKE